MNFQVTYKKNNVFLLEENVWEKNSTNINFGAFDLTDTTFYMVARCIITLHS